MSLREINYFATFGIEIERCVEKGRGSHFVYCLMIRSFGSNDFCVGMSLYGLYALCASNSLPLIPTP